MRLAVLISGAGSNMVAIARACQEGRIPAQIAVVLSDQADAGGLQRARELGLPVALVDRKRYRGDDGRIDKQAFEAELESVLRQHGAEVLILAGFMAILSAGFVTRHAGRILNIHPSLLPRHPGLDTHARALAAGDEQHGASVHFVTPELDGGPLVVQAPVAVLPGDDVASLSARVHAQEHIIYPMSISWLATRRLQWNDGAPTLDGMPLHAPVQYHPVQRA
jgi:phosphoribosylglycinamide formyltransferase-1